MSDFRNVFIHIIDDDQFMRGFLRTILRDIGIEKIEEFSNGDSMLRALKLSKPDIMFLDIVLPGVDGIELIDEIKTLSPDTTIIMVSGESTIEKVKEAIGKGAKDFIAKPFNATSIVSKLTGILNKFNKDS